MQIDENLKDLMIDGFWLVNKKLEIVDVNKSYCDMSGYTKEELLRMKITDLDIIDNEEVMKARLSKLMVEGYDNFESKHKRKDDTIFFVSVSINKVFQEEDIFFIALFRDITEKITEENELKDIKEKLEILINNIEEVFWIRSPDNKRMVWISPSYEKIWGRSRESLYENPNSFIDTILESDKEKVFKEYEKYFMTGVFNLDYRIVKGNGETVWINAKSFQVKNESGGLIYNVGRALDISKRKETEEQLIKANRAKSEFLSNMSHEIRTPMNGINGFVGLLLDMEVDTEKRELLEIVRYSSNQLLAIINDILSFSKIEAGKMEIKENKTNLLTKLDLMTKCFIKQAEVKKLDFQFEADRNLDKDILIDEYALLQILNNLLSNAIKFTGKGYIKLAVRETLDKKIEIIVKDTGIGINEEKQKNIYEAFYQGEHYLTKQYGGTGLGLAIVKRIVDLMNGEIFVTTEIGEGTEFRVIIPFREVEKRERIEKEEKNELSLKQKLKIISAEDVEVNQKLLEKILKSDTVHFKKVYDGQELLEELDREDYHLVLMDIQMPVLNGIDASIAIRNHQKHREIPIIGVSAYAFEEDVEKMKKAGINDCISKPVKKEELISKINKWAKTKNV